LEPARKHRLQSMIHHGLFVVLLIVLTTLLAYLARQYRVEIDLTRGHRNTLSAATLDVLKRLDGPVSITAYAMERDARGEHVHRRIEEFVRPYQRAKPDVALTLVEPRKLACARRSSWWWSTNAGPRTSPNSMSRPSPTR